MNARQLSIHRGLESPIIGSAQRHDNPPTPTAERPIIISASELRDFLRCRVMWNWRHQARLETVERNDNLAIGTVVHAGKEAWYKLPFPQRSDKAMAKIARKVVRDKQVEQLNTEHRELVEAMLNGYAAWATVQDREDGLVEAFPEEWFDLPLNDEQTIRIRGKLDLRFQPKGRKKVMSMVESKTRASIKVEFIEMNLQCSVYLWALQQRFPKCTEFEGHFQVLRKQLPGPRVTAPLFNRESFTRTTEELEQWRIDAIAAAWDMLDAAIYPNPMDSCAWSCDYKNPCLLRGSPELHDILTTEYQPKKERS
jgi:hypothetical protein